MVEVVVVMQMSIFISLSSS